MTKRFEEVHSREKKTNYRERGFLFSQIVDLMVEPVDRSFSVILNQRYSQLVERFSRLWNRSNELFYVDEHFPNRLNKFERQRDFHRFVYNISMQLDDADDIHL